MNVLLNNCGESTGSIGYRNYNLQQSCPPGTPNCDSVNFKGRDDDDDHKEKGSSFLKTVAGLGIAAAAIIGGLGIAHKKDVFSKIKNQKVKDFLSKAEPAAETCHKWCAKVKQTGKNLLEKIKTSDKKSS